MKKEKLNLTHCNNNSTSIQLYIGNDKNFNLTDFLNNVDLYNPNSKLYNDRCTPLNQNDTEFTIMERRKKFSGKVLACSSGCVYRGVNKTTLYTICECWTGSSNTLTANFSKVILSAITMSNYEIALCYHLFLNFTPMTILLNLAFLIFSSLAVSLVTILSIVSCVNKNMFYDKDRLDYYIYLNAQHLNFNQDKGKFFKHYDELENLEKVKSKVS